MQTCVCCYLHLLFCLPPCCLCFALLCFCLACGAFVEVPGAWAFGDIDLDVSGELACPVHILLEPDGNAYLCDALGLWRI